MHLSIKTRITLWFTSFMIILAVIVLSFMLLSGRQLIESFSIEKLISIVDEGVAEVEFTKEGGRVEDDDLKPIIEGVYLYIYNSQFKKIEGLGESVHADFTDRKVQKITSVSGELWYIYDRYKNAKNYGSVWVRGAVSGAVTGTALETFFYLALVSFPFLIALAAAGGWFLTYHALLPVSKIGKAVEAIEKGNDLSKRIEVKDVSSEIGDLANKFNKMFDRLKHSFEKEKQFTSDVSHELRTPLSVIISQCEYALENQEEFYGNPNCNNDNVKESLSVIMRHAKKISFIISQLLTFARADSGKEKLYFERINFSSIANAVSHQMEETANKKNIKIKTEIESDVFIEADESLIMRLLINLISNSITYGIEGGFILLQVYCVEDNVICSVSDNGIGIEEKHLNCIWDRFYQIDPVRCSLSGGTGLGLAMVKWIAESHRGTVSVESKSGKGSLFSVIIPQKHKK